MSHLPIPTDKQVNDVWHAIKTDILNAHRRCAPISEIEALHAKQHNQLMAVNLIGAVKDYNHKARALNARSDTPGLSDSECSGLRSEAQHYYELAHQNLRRAYVLLDLPFPQ